MMEKNMNNIVDEEAFRAASIADGGTGKTGYRLFVGIYELAKLEKQKEREVALSANNADWDKLVKKGSCAYIDDREPSLPKESTSIDVVEFITTPKPEVPLYYCGECGSTNVQTKFSDKGLPVSDYYGKQSKDIKESLYTKPTCKLPELPNIRPSLGFSSATQADMNAIITYLQALEGESQLGGGV